MSQSYAEIYNIHAFFSGATESTLHAANATVLYMPAEKRKTIDGDRRLRRIARAGSSGNGPWVGGWIWKVRSSVFVCSIFALDTLFSCALLHFRVTCRPAHF